MITEGEYITMSATGLFTLVFVVILIIAVLYRD